MVGFGIEAEDEHEHDMTKILPTCDEPVMTLEVPMAQHAHSQHGTNRKSMGGYSALPAKLNESEKAMIKAGRIPVKCGSLSAVMHLNLFATAKKGACMEMEDGRMLTIDQFHTESGKSATSFWARRIRFNHHSMQRLMLANCFHRHSIHCKCKICSDGIKNEPPAYRHASTTGARSKVLLASVPVSSVAEEASDSSNIFDNIESSSLSAIGHATKSEHRRFKTYSNKTQEMALQKAGLLNVQWKEGEETDDDEKDYNGNKHCLCCKLWSNTSKPTICKKRQRLVSTPIQYTINMCKLSIPAESPSPSPSFLIPSCSSSSAPSALSASSAPSAFSAPSAPSVPSASSSSSALDRCASSTLPLKRRRRKMVISSTLEDNGDVLVTKQRGKFEAFDDIEILVVPDGSVLQPENVSCGDLISVLPDVCLDCYNDTQNSWCRFAGFRMLKREERFTLRRIGFVMASGTSAHLGKALVEIEEYLPKRLTKMPWQQAAYLLQNVASLLETVIGEETQTLAMVRLNLKGRKMRMPYWRSADSVRELCDVCHTTIFNLHFICPSCAFAVCAACVRDRNSKRTRPAEASQEKKFDWYQWPLCPNGDVPECHQPRLLKLTQIIPDRYPSILSTMIQLRYRMRTQIDRYNIATTSCVCDQDQERRCFCLRRETPIDRLSFICGGCVLLIRADAPELLAHFQCQWRLSRPVLVSDVAINGDLWRPETFRHRIVNAEGIETAIVDCRTGKAVGYSERRPKGVTLIQFWNGYSHHQQRVADPITKNSMYLKLKDFPTNATFSEALPEHYADFCRALPVPEYTRPECDSNGLSTGGSLNLVTRLPDSYVRPDLGPKMYNAYGMLYETSRATTNLHMDITDAVNLLANVTVPGGMNEEYERKELMKHLISEGIDPNSAEFARIEKNWRKAGAIWTIWQPMDNGSIRDFIREMMDEGLFDANQYRDTDDPIHDQRFYLTGDLRRELRKRHGIQDYTFVQMEGDAVFIPAGAAHQVQNLFSCIKVAEDFVSPEGCRNSAFVTNELRHLTRQHQNHEDKLQLSNIVYHAVCEAVAVLEENDENVKMEEDN